ncbi:MAG: MOSC domain-containing protein [Pseudomonadota bacterium]
MATLIGIAIKPHHEQVMRELSEALLSCERGVEGDSRGKPGPRQVTVLSLAAWQAAGKELGIDFHWSQRRANLLVDMLDLEQSSGAHIHIGDAILEVTGETDPCRRMEALHTGLFDALAKEWRGGVTCRVVKGGVLTVGETVMLNQPS